MPAAELAGRAGVSRQTIYAIEDGSFIPNTAIALRLGRVLGVSVEALFPLDEAAQESGFAIRTELLDGTASELRPGQPVRLCSVGRRTLAVPVSPVSNFLPTADGVIERFTGRGAHVRSIRPVGEKGKTLLIAGCDPALSFVEELFGASDFRVVIIPCSSRKALEWLKQGRIHVAGSHLRDPVAGEYNTPAVKRLFSKGGVRVVTFAAWEEGLVTRHTNPKSIRSIADFARSDVTIINREKGSGSRGLLDSGLAKAGIRASSVTGFGRAAEGHLPAAYAVVSGSADSCIATRSAARCFGLEFVPLAAERFDLVIAKSTAATSVGAALLDLLNQSSLRQKLRMIAGYDTSHTGAVLM